MRTLLAGALGSDADCVVLESGLLSDPTAGGNNTSAPASNLRPEVLVCDIEATDTLQQNRAIALRRARNLPSLIFVGGLSSDQEARLTGAGFTTVRRRPDIRSFTTAGGRAPVIDILHALARHGNDTAARTHRPAPVRQPATGETNRSEPTPPSAAPAGASGSPALRKPSAVPPIIVIGASTGGPQAVRRVLEDLPAPLAAPVAIVQHISDGFAEGFVRWLRDTTFRSVEIAQDGTALRADTFVVAPSGLHLVVNYGGIALREGEKEQYQRPSADVLFRTAAAAYGSRVIAILLTGMGRDGADGCRVVQERGGITLVQDEETSVVYGMPRAAAEMGAATEILPLNAIGKRAGVLLERIT
jgi:chemotaxis response regulator CheB